MKKIYFSFIFYFLLLSSMNSQQHLVDSLTKELQHPMADSSRAVSMMRLAIDYEIVDTTKAYNMYRQAIKFASEKKLYFQLGRIYQNQSFLFSTAGNYQKTRASLDTAILCYQQSNHPKAKRWEASANMEIGNVLKVQNELKQSAKYYLKNISLLEMNGLETDIVSAYCNLSILYGDIQENTKQKEYAHKAILKAKKGGTKTDKFLAYYILANAYSMHEENILAKKYIDSAKVNFVENSNIDTLFSYYLVSAQVYRKLNQFNAAIIYLQKCYDVSEKNHYSYGIAESLLQLGGVSIQQKKYDDAEKYLMDGIKKAESVGYFNMIKEGYKYLSDIYAVTGRYKEAYESFQKHKEINDSIVILDSKKYATEIEKKYESEKKDVQIKLQQLKLKQKNTLNYILIGSSIAMLLFMFLLYRNYTHKQKMQQHRINELEKEKQLEATEAVLKGEEQERIRLAKDLHDGLGGMLSGIKYSFQTMKQNLIMTPDNQLSFERSMDMLDSSIKEMRRVAHNMMPESLVKFGLDTAVKDFCNEINISGALNINYQSVGMQSKIIDQTTSITVYRVIQELINNIIKHASANSAIVQLTFTDSILTLTVEDDGKGFNIEKLNTSKGIGWENIKNRIDFLGGIINVDSEPGNGTSVHIEINT